MNHRDGYMAMAYKNGLLPEGEKVRYEYELKMKEIRERHQREVEEYQKSKQKEAYDQETERIKSLLSSL